MAIEKEKLAIYMLIGLVVVGLGVYSWSLYGDDKTEGTGEEKASVGFEAPSNNPEQAKKEKEKYKSSLDIYEQNHKADEELEEEHKANIGFEKYTDKGMKEESEKSAEPVYKAPANRPKQYAGSSNQSRQSSYKAPVNEETESVQEVQPEVVRTKKKGLISASGNNTNNTATLATVTSFPVVVISIIIEIQLAAIKLGKYLVNIPNSS